MTAADFLRLHLAIRTVDLRCQDHGVSWPPPERIVLEPAGSKLVIRRATEDDDPDIIMRRVRMSSISDDDAARMDRVARGAEYEYERDAQGVIL